MKHLKKTRTAQKADSFVSAALPVPTRYTARWLEVNAAAEAGELTPNAHNKKPVRNGEMGRASIEAISRSESTDCAERYDVLMAGV